jgi:hypothetical protein
LPIILSKTAVLPDFTPFTVSANDSPMGAASQAFQGAYTDGFIGVKHGFKTLTL